MTTSDVPHFAAESTLDIQGPDNRHATLSRMDFQVIKDGESAGPKGTRDLCIGVAVTSLLGVLSFFYSVDWVTKLKAGDSRPILFMFVQAVLFVSAIGLAIYFAIQARANQKLSAYSVLIERLENHFSAAVDK